MSDQPERLLTDLLQEALLEDGADPREYAMLAVVRATMSCVDALAWLDGQPDRCRYVQTLAELHPDDAPGMLATAAGWIRDSFVDPHEVTVLPEEP